MLCIALLPRVTVPFAVRFVTLAAAGVVPPIVVPSIVPPLISAVVMVPLLILAVEILAEVIEALLNVANPLADSVSVPILPILVMPFVVVDPITPRSPLIVASLATERSPPVKLIPFAAITLPAIVT